MGKTENDEIYQRGVKDGQNGWFLEDLAQGIASGFSTNQKEDIYNKGYKYGAENRHNSKSSGEGWF